VGALPGAHKLIDIVQGYTGDMGGQTRADAGPGTEAATKDKRSA
jgi:hypothetical protein